jgi:hypothetical protein
MTAELPIRKNKTAYRLNNGKINVQWRSTISVFKG